MKNLVFIAFIILVSCKSKVIQYPVNYDNDREKFMEFSQNLNKQILEEDNQLIENYIDSLGRKFTKTSYGFWISNSGNPTATTANTGDLVQFTSQISRFDNEIVYSEEETGTQSVLLGKTDIPRGVHIALQLIEKGDSATVLFPSFMVYGSFGDQNKIFGNEPLIYKIHMLDIKKNNR